MRKYVIILLIGLIANKNMAQNNKQIYCFEPDIRIFTAYAFLNAGGFDHDWLKMDTVRVETRIFIDSILHDDFKQKITDYIKRTKLSWYECGAYVLNLDKAPTFNWICDTCNPDLKNDFIGLDTLYRQFYKKANIQILWNKYKKEIDSINYSYQPYAQRAIDDIISFTRIVKDYYLEYSSNIHFMVCPLMSHFTAFNHRVNNTLYLVQGPSQGQPGPGAFYHEALHPPIGSIIDKHKDLLINLGKLNDCAQEKLKGNYPDIISLLNESFVRTIDKYLVGQYYQYDSAKTFKMIADEYKLGFIFCLYIYENIPEYLNSGKSLEEYYPILMSNLDIKKEINRWRNCPKDDKK
ncbi:MAG: hypothetical protein JW973_11695 [Bacteroidales bacterium]|nr:hypothetical protein [Bacteroidales bacterium]